MQVLFRIKRKEIDQESSYWEEVPYTPKEDGQTVATALKKMNETMEHPIEWDCSCLQKKCGACAMIINGRPGLACDTLLSDCGGEISLEPLRKFPVVQDLMVDRDVMMRNLRQMEVWLETERAVDETGAGVVYEASRCLQCGLCLEVCPNFFPDGEFSGAASMVPASRLFTGEKKGERELKKNYKKKVYEGCAKALSCRDICPADIPIEDLLIRSNAAAVWKRRKR